MVTTVLDLVGCLLVVLALAVLVWPWTPAGALAVAGLGLIALSWAIDKLKRRGGSA